MANWEVRRWLQTNQTTLRLTASYLLIIMIMSAGFSLIFYSTSAHELTRQLRPEGWLSIDQFGNYHAFFQQRISESEQHLLRDLLLLNFTILLCGTLFSYFLARRTLMPIEKAMDSQARFAADASHELRTPLAVMQTENEVALRNSKLTLPEAKDLIGSNLEEVRRLHDMAEALLALASGDKFAHIPREKVNLAAATAASIEHCQKAIQEKHLKIDNKTGDLLAIGNFAGIKQILIILLDNAVKYSDEGKTISLTARADDTWAFLNVQDQGVGIAEDDLPHIFERFYRADKARSKKQVEGYGLGLALAAKIVKQLGGAITAESQIGKGSTFTVKLPLH